MLKIFLILFILPFHQGFCQTQKNKKVKNNDTVIICRAEKTSEFLGGDKAWKKYLDTNIAKINIEDFFSSPKKDSLIKAEIRFTINEKGFVENVIENTASYGILPNLLFLKLKKIFINSPRWIPETQNGKYVKSFRVQPLSILLESNEN